MQLQESCIYTPTNLQSYTVTPSRYVESIPRLISTHRLMTSKANFLIDDEGNARLCDFGLSRILSEDVPSGLTTTSQYMGTERYMSYELVLAEGLGQPTTASDVYALACTGLEVSQGNTKLNIQLTSSSSSFFYDFHMRAFSKDAFCWILALRLHQPFDQHLSPMC